MKDNRKDVELFLMTPTEFMMPTEQLTVLVVEDNADDAELMSGMLQENATAHFVITRVDRLAAALDALESQRFDVALLDLSLPDSDWNDTITKLHTQSPDLPIVVLTGVHDEHLALTTVHEGAQDYLVKGEVDSTVLVRAVRYAIERQRLKSAIRVLSLSDDLTGLYNRRGFLTLAEHALKLAARIPERFILLYADLDHFKRINDQFGHREGDKVLAAISEIFRKTFRESDIIARMGGDEFVVLAKIAKPEDYYVLTTRLQANLEEYNGQGEQPIYLSLSLGMARFDPKNPCTIDQLLVRADQSMYEDKRCNR
ncbi:MAG: GGDEF domain-containing protein [Armatimonadota bacterium]